MRCDQVSPGVRGSLKVQVWRFGEIEFDESSGRLRVSGKPVEIDRSSRAILALLLNGAGSTIDKDRLLRAGWPNRTVHENSLTKAIGRLRDALGHHGAALKSVYGYGYRLDAEVERVMVRWSDGEEPSQTPGIVERLFGAKRWQHGVTVTVGSLLVLTGAAVALSQLQAGGVPDPSELRRTEPPIIRDAPDSIGRILWVDDHPQNNLYEKRLFEDRRISVHTVINSADALKLIAIYRYDLVISDMGRGEDRLAGLRLAEAVRERGIKTPFLIYTVQAAGAAAQQAQSDLVAEAGADGLAVTPEEIRRAVLRIFDYPAPRPAD